MSPPIEPGYYLIQPAADPKSFAGVHGNVQGEAAADSVEHGIPGA